MTRLCVSLFVREAEPARRDISRAIEAGADLVELRLDELTHVDQLRPVIDGIDFPFIYTCRPESDGGYSRLEEAERINFLLACRKLRPGWMDIELRTLEANPDAFAGQSDLIVSHHDYESRPDLLYKTLGALARHGDVSKIAWRARSVRDNTELFDLLLTRPRPMIALCMGEAGLASRVLAKKFNAYLTFASLDDEQTTAPGQVSIDQMKNLYRWDALTPATRVYGVIAKPVQQSMSPTIHNAAFAHANHDGVYLPFLVEPNYESFKAFVELFLHQDQMHLSGLSVTLPHKENALHYLKEKNTQIDELAERIGTVNTLIFDRSEPHVKVLGRNTDYAAILDCITDKLGITREQLAGRDVAVLGAGGTGRTATAALAHYGANVTVYNRTQFKADLLVEAFDGKRGKVTALPMELLPDAQSEIYINTTSVGMYPNVSVSPFGDTPPKLTAQSLVFDTIYNPPRTKLMTQAQDLGAMTIGGVEMFVRQAGAQFEAWLGQPAPVEVMRAAFEAKLPKPPRGAKTGKAKK